MTDFLINIIGWAGVALLIIAYWLVSTKRCQGNSILYQMLNIIGAFLLISILFTSEHILQWV